MSSNHSALPSVIGQDAYAGPDCDPDQKGQGQAGHTFSMALKQVVPTPPSLKTHMRLASQPFVRPRWIGKATRQAIGRTLSFCSHVIHRPPLCVAPESSPEPVSCSQVTQIGTGSCP